MIESIHRNAVANLVEINEGMSKLLDKQFENINPGYAMKMKERKYRTKN